MRSGTSFFDLTIYRKTFTRFWPLWVLNLVIWLFILPFSGLIEITRYQPYRNPLYANAYQFARSVGDTATDFGIIFALVFALVVAMAVCSHLYNNRSANFMGALPARREGQFLSTYLSGLTMLIAPNVVVFLLTLLVEAIGGAVMWVPLLFWLAVMCGTEFFFYSFAVCLGQFTGHILVLPVYYGIFNAIVVAVYGLLGWVMNRYYFGFTGMGAMGSGFVMWCTPVVTFYEMDIDVYSEPVAEGMAEQWVVDIEGLWIAGIYAIVAVVLTACALLLYRRRHLETAGDIVAVKIMRPVFKYGVAFCAGMFLGFLFDQMFSLSEVGMLVWTVIWGVVGYFIAQMLLDKSIRVFRKWKGAAAVTVVFLVVFAVIGFDITGYETRVPAADQVQSVTIDGLDGNNYYDTGSYVDDVVLTDPEEIADVIALHQAIVEVGEDGEPDSGGLYTNYVSFDVSYTLKNGGKLSRSYRLNMGERLMPLVREIRNSETVRRQAYRLDEVEQWQAQGAELASANIEYEDEYGYISDERYGSDAQRLWNAVMADFEAGRIGVYRDGSENTLGRLYFYWEKERITNEPGNDPGSYEPSGSVSTKPVAVDTIYVEFVVTEQATETMKLLNELLVPDNRYQENPDDNPLWRSE